MAVRLKPYFFFFLLIGVTACKKNHDKPANTAPAPNVYVLGSSGDTAEYWKNGAGTALMGSLGTINATVMAVSDSNVYVAGTVSAGDQQFHAEYWKNGVGVTLPDSTGMATVGGIFVSGSDVYVAGSMFYNAPSTAVFTTLTAVYPKAGWVANYWHNGVPVQLPGQSFPGGPMNATNDLYDNYVSGIYESGGTVYVSGGSNEYQGGVSSTYQFAQYWNQGVATNLAGPGFIDSSGGQVTGRPTTTGIYVSGTDVYVSGIVTGAGYDQAVYWKNGAATVMGNGHANSIYVSGGDVYVAGFSVVNGLNAATYWKNGTATVLGTSGQSTTANSIYVSGSDVYVAGIDVVNGLGYATYWKNGVATHLSPGQGGATAIYVQ